MLLAFLLFPASLLLGFFASLLLHFSASLFLCFFASLLLHCSASLLLFFSFLLFPASALLEPKPNLKPTLN
jgi:hypothetical protein